MVERFSTCSIGAFITGKLNTGNYGFLLTKLSLIIFIMAMMFILSRGNLRGHKRCASRPISSVNS